MQVRGVVGFVYTCWGSRYVLKVRETRAHHQEDYSTWSNPIMAKNMFEHPYVILQGVLYLKYYNTIEWIMCMRHGWQLGHDVIYLVYITNPQMFVGWLHGHMWEKPFPPSIWWCIVIMTFYVFMLVEVTRNTSLGSAPYTWWIDYRYFEVKQEDNWLTANIKLLLLDIIW